MFVIGYLLVALAFLAVGLCLLISPGTYFRLLDRMARTDLWAKPTSSWDPKAPRWRVAGLAPTLFALYLIVGAPLLVYLRSPEEFNQRLHSSHHSVSWGTLIVLLFFFALGMGFLVRPLAVVDRFSPRKLSAEPDAQQHVNKLRIFGGFLLFFSILGMWVQLLRHFRH